MYETIAVIGLGSLGGFLCKHLSELQFVKKLVIVDFDKVSNKDTFKTIYQPRDVDDYKVDALSWILKDNVLIDPLNFRYEEGATHLPKCDLVIDCRDEVCNRKDEIDARIYISQKVLIIDCRKRVQIPQSYIGSYSVNLTKTEINRAAFFAAQIIENNAIEDAINNQLIQRINLDMIKDIMSKSISESMSNKVDMIYDTSQFSTRIHGLEQNIKPILTMNSRYDTEVYIGEKSSKDNTKLIIPKQKLRNSLDLLQEIKELMDRQPGVTNFLITIRKSNGRQHVELLEETGAA